MFHCIPVAAPADTPGGPRGTTGSPAPGFPYDPDMDAADAARNWAAVWSEAWPKRDIDAILALYADSVVYRALAFREADRGPDGVRRYLNTNFAVEDEIECRFGDPIVADDRAAVEWWASWIERGEQLTLAGVTVLRFDPDGKVVDHRDYWNEIERLEPPYAGW